MILLVACGNVLRRDDGAGIVLGRRLRRTYRAGLQVVLCQQLTPDLAPRLADPRVATVIFVDAAVTDSASAAPSARLRCLSEAGNASSLGHHLGPTALLDFAARLYGRRPPAWLAVVPGEDFGFGVGLSRRTRCELRGVEKEIRVLFPAGAAEK